MNTRGYCWTQVTAIGLVSANIRVGVITVDLGVVKSIHGASYNISPCVAGVHCPMHVFMLRTDNDSTWFVEGDRVSLDRAASVPSL